MWWNRPNPMTMFLVAIFVGITSMLVTAFWSVVPNADAISCHDTIEVIKGSLSSASCDTDQSLMYMRDFSGERYIICHCNLNAKRRGQPWVPNLPGILLMPLPEQVQTDEENNDDFEPNINNNKTNPDTAL